jgi:hypothetical protein
MFHRIKLDAPLSEITCIMAEPEYLPKFILPVTTDFGNAKFKENCWVRYQPIKKSKIFKIPKIENFEIETMYEYFKQYGKCALYFALTGTHYYEVYSTWEFDHLIYGFDTKSKYCNTYTVDFDYLKKFETFNKKIVKAIENKFNTKMRIAADVELIETDFCYIFVEKFKVFPKEFTHEFGIRDSIFSTLFYAVEELYTKYKGTSKKSVTLAQAIHELFGYEILAGYLRFIGIDYLKLKI